MNIDDLANLLEGVAFDAKVELPEQQISAAAAAVYREHVEGLGETTEQAMRAVVRFVLMEAVPVAIQQVLAAIGAQAVINDAYISGGDDS
jgi:hypothetical protein